ncbi:MAG: cyanophycinase [Pseudomonadota bacterium]
MKAASSPKGLACWLALIAASCAAQPAPMPTVQSETPRDPARLVIVGGGLRASQTDIFDAFLDDLGEGAIVIIPVASAEPNAAARRAITAFTANRVDPSRLVVAPIAAVDDPKTDDVNEALWADNVDDRTLADSLRAAAGIWFTGGDPGRLMDALDDSLVLDAIRDAYARGSVLGGTSAGATIMAERMIRKGHALPSLRQDVYDDGAVQIGPGFGFFSRGIIDQHFLQRGRVGRLVAALADDDVSRKRGFGIDEGTGLVLRQSGTLEVIGYAHVTLIDASVARFDTTDSGAMIADDLRLSLLAAGDRIAPDGRLIPSNGRNPTIGDEYRETASATGVGLAFPPGGLPGAIGLDLVDASNALQRVERSFDANGNGVAFTFTQDDHTEGYWGRTGNGRGLYTVHNVELSITPLNARFSEPAEHR